jgi:hypothetical protein
VREPHFSLCRMKSRTSAPRGFQVEGSVRPAISPHHTGKGPLQVSCDHRATVTRMNYADISACRPFAPKFGSASRTNACAN